MNDIILGAGISGRILKHFFPDALVLEANGPVSHLNSTMGANYVWKPLDGFHTEPVRVVTTVDGQFPQTESIRRYKNKIGKDMENEEDWKEQFKPVQHGHLLVCDEVLPAMYDTRVTHIDMLGRKVYAKVGDHNASFDYGRILSTLPLPVLVKLCDMDVPHRTPFRFQPIYVKVEKSVTDAGLMRVDYVSSPCDNVYRITEKSGERHYESLSPFTGEYKTLFPGKIWNSPLTHDIKSKLAEEWIFTFGRYASWNSDELIHQTYEQVARFKQGGLL